ncbi:hypothetical protein SEPCBS119000_004307 [Sporothrix epigloea]|uniref:Clock-controlled pheromone ccg-4 n=1 Tax=Sporothrix epigloea TaxID=1892477 RepID=A0ABP0DVA0_9PEZI
MKATAIFAALAIGATGVSAAAVAKHYDEFCRLHNQPCWKVKRAAEAFAEAISSSGSPAAGTDLLFRRSHADGGVAYIAMRSLDGLATLVSSTQSEPRSFYQDLQLAERFPEPTTLTEEELAARDTDVEKREAEAEASRKHKICPGYDQSCWKAKREAEAEAEAEAHRFKGICPLHNQSCWKAKRAAEAKAEAEAEAHRFKGICPLHNQSCWKAKRAAEADPEAVSSCGASGGSCWKVQRAAEAIVNTIDGFAETEKREAEAEASPKYKICPGHDQSCWKAKREAEAEAEAKHNKGWCPLYDQSCFKRSEASVEARCFAPGGDCAAATRDLSAMYHAARQVLDMLPSQ